MNQADLYAELLGDEARRRQEELARDRFVCCGEPKTSGHHQDCSLRPADEPAPVAEGQTSLI